jgi:hypothetical protein
MKRAKEYKERGRGKPVDFASLPLNFIFLKFSGLNEID